MRKITTYQLLKAAKRNIILILTPAILVFALVLSQTILKMSKTYQADAMLMITGVQKGDPVGYNNIILNEKLANIYAGFLESSDLYEAVSEKLPSGSKDVDIKKNLESDVNPQAGVISFTYTDVNKDRACLLYTSPSPRD